MAQQINQYPWKTTPDIQGVAVEGGLVGLGGLVIGVKDDESGLGWITEPAPGYAVGDVRRYGAVLDGLTDCTAAFQAASAASLTPYAPSGTAVITGTIEVREGQTWTLDGTIIKITGTSTVSFLANELDEGFYFNGNYTFEGDNNANGSLSGSSAGIKVVGGAHYRISGCRGDRIKGWGVVVEPGTGTAPLFEKGQIINPQMNGCYFGIEMKAGSGAEYCTIVAPLISKCDTGISATAGNTVVIGGSVSGNRVNVYLTTGSNSAHGTFSGTLINHATDFNIYADNVTNGHSFTGCHIYDGDLFFDECKGLIIVGGHFAPGRIYINSGAESGYNYVRQAYCPSGYPPVLDPSNTGNSELIFSENWGPGSYYASSGISINDPSPVYVYAERLTGQTVSSTVASTIVFNNVDQYGNRRLAYNDSTGQATIPAGMGGQYSVSGTILANASTSFAANASSCEIKVHPVTGPDRLVLILPAYYSTDKLAFAWNAQMYLNEGDEVSVVATLTGTGTLTVGGSGYIGSLSITRIG